MRTRVKITCGKNKWGNVWKVARKRKRWNSPNFYVYARHFINCPCFNYGRKICVRTHVKITRQWKSTLPLQFCLLKLIGEVPRGLAFGIFERRTSSGSEPFPLLISLDATVFILPSVLILTETICPKTCSKSRLKSAKRAFPVDVRRSKTSLLKLPILFLSPPQGNWSPEHAASPPTNVVRIVFKSWYSVYRL